MNRYLLCYMLVAATTRAAISMKLGQQEFHDVGVRKSGTGSGDPQFHTVDGKQYSFDGNCSYVLLRECQDPLEQPRFSVNIVNSRTLKTPYKYVVYIDSVYVIINLEGGGVFRVDLLQNKYLSINNNTSIHIVDIVDKWEDKTNGISIKEKDNKIVVTKKNEFCVCWDGIGRVDVKVDDSFHGKVCGLMGTANNDPDDDFKMLTTEGLKLVEDVKEFANSWQIKDSCKIK
uniref:Zonadhesin-like n=1 Tax=Saccoglossus kowalevskii TaxID=10224 RepID=A0ABM0MKI8_SACKO|nr:PREDICTED: zonadhesin-like [Saccoglossus kowalevskii]